jgi:hypothetical protein
MWLLRGVVRLLFLIPIAWAASAIWFDGPSSRLLAGALVGSIGLFGALCLLLLPFGRALLVSALLVAAVLAWWLSIPPRQDRDWMLDVARVARTTRNGDLITIENIRNFRYRSETDYDVHWETRTYDLSKMKGVDLFLVTWGAPGIAHTIASWEFEDQPPLAISIETRKQKGESYSAIRGFFRQYELYYVVADERDVIGVRASHRGERPSLYRIDMYPENAKKLLLRYLDEVDDLAAKPRWYNALTHNCTTEIRWNLMAIGLKNPLDWRIYANAHLPELMYERKSIDTSLPLAELVKLSDITEKAKAADGAPDFSQRIRKGLPGM